MPKMVNGGAVLPKTALFSSQEAVSFKFSHQSGIDHFLHNFAEATSQCYWAVIRRIRQVFASFWNGYNLSFFPGRRKEPGSPDLIINFEQNFERRSRKVFDQIVMYFVGTS